MIYILDAASKAYTMTFVRITRHNGRWCVLEGLTRR